MTLLDIQNKLHQYYPDLEIVIWQKGDKGKLFVNNKQILKFNAEVLNLQLSNASDDFVSDTIKMFCNFIEKKYISRKNRFGKSVGRTGKNLTEAQIKDAISKTKSNTFRSAISKCIFLFEDIYFFADLKALLQSKYIAKNINFILQIYCFFWKFYLHK